MRFPELFRARRFVFCIQQEQRDVIRPILPENRPLYDPFAVLQKTISNPSPKKVAYSPYPEYLPIDGMNNGNYDRKGNHGRSKS